MVATNRSALLTKMHKVLKKHYKPVALDDNRTVLEHMLFAVCLENTAYESAEKVFQGLLKSFIDWNDVRVSTTRELSEVMQSLADPTAAAENMRRILQHVFESRYSFDLQSLQKENLGAASKRLEQTPGASPFVVAYTVQAGLGGHMVPVDKGAMQALEIVGVVTPQEAAQHSVPGMERAIPKNKGLEFGSLLHQLSAELIANCYSPSVHKVLLEINDEAKTRLPKRGAKKAVEESAKPGKHGSGESKSSRSTKRADESKKSSGRESSKAEVKRKPR